MDVHKLCFLLDDTFFLVGMFVLWVPVQRIRDGKREGKNE